LSPGEEGSPADRQHRERGERFVARVGQRKGLARRDDEGVARGEGGLLPVEHHLRLAGQGDEDLLAVVADRG
jgi:hypothetical protein